MTGLVHVHCPCGWHSGRRLQVDGTYGPCRRCLRLITRDGLAPIQKAVSRQNAIRLRRGADPEAPKRSA